MRCLCEGEVMLGRESWRGRSGWLRKWWGVGETAKVLRRRKERKKGAGRRIIV